MWAIVLGWGGAVTVSESHPVRKFEGCLAESEGQLRDPLIGYPSPTKKAEKKIRERPGKKTKTKSMFYSRKRELEVGRLISDTTLRRAFLLNQLLVLEIKLGFVELGERTCINHLDLGRGRTG